MDKKEVRSWIYFFLIILLILAILAICLIVLIDETVGRNETDWQKQMDRLQGISSERPSEDKE